MALTLYNTLSRKKEIFKPIEDKKVGFYSCGPTVYDRVHIGNLRTYVFEDVLKKTLRHGGYKVKHAMNITDVEDKIIKKMRSEKKTLEQVTRPYTELFLKNTEKLNIEKADFLPAATEHIKEMVGLIETLLKKGFAYKGADGSIYFNASKFKNYGKLSLLKKRALKHGARIASDEYNKENAGDFVLWKTSAADEPSWEAPFGKGRPGWHIECSAMSMKYLGKSFDIHAGAVDLIFPHHENEIAQSEAATGKKFVNFWIEGEHLLVDNKKMAKSAGNFFTLEDIEEKRFSPLSFRYLILNTHYRTKLNFTWEALRNSQNSYGRLKNIIGSLKDDEKSNKKYLADFEKAINNDLDTPKALATLWRLLRDRKAQGKVKTIAKMDEIFGLDLLKKEKIEIPAEIIELAGQREKARAKKDWQKADELRQKIAELGWLAKDTASGPILKKKI